MGRNTIPYAFRDFGPKNPRGADFPYQRTTARFVARIRHRIHGLTGRFAGERSVGLSPRIRRVQNRSQNAGRQVIR